jgi:hypothetical protein
MFKIVRKQGLFFTKNFLNSSPDLFFLAVSRKYMVNISNFVRGILPWLSTLSVSRFPAAYRGD